MAKLTAEPLAVAAAFLPMQRKEWRKERKKERVFFGGIKERVLNADDAEMGGGGK